MWIVIPIDTEVIMLKTIQITLPDQLLARLDTAVTELDTNRSVFARQAFELALARQTIARKEQQDAEGYARQPVQPDEFDVWQVEQTWGEA
jgi:metal-responsive CopG/Arc/MetJ family transcriptional regulator